MLIKGVPQRLSDPTHAVAAGIGMVPGERGLGLIMNQSVRDNILLASLDRLGSLKGFDRGAADRIVNTLMELLDIRPRRPETDTGVDRLTLVTRFRRCSSGRQTRSGVESCHRRMVARALARGWSSSP